jgi:hypothetical protein
MSQSANQSKTCAQCTGYDSTKTGCYFKLDDYFWGTATLAQVKATDLACDCFKGIEPPF